MTDFDLYLGIDYSGAQTPTARLKGLQVPAPGKSVVAEVYPSIFRNRYPREGRTADKQDACATARWMSDMDARGALARYFAPPLTDLERSTAGREGWILGVM
jgi:hypothetical protein